MRQVLLEQGFLVFYAHSLAQLFSLLLHHVLGDNMTLDLRSMSALNLTGVVLTIQEGRWLLPRRLLRTKLGVMLRIVRKLVVVALDVLVEEDRLLAECMVLVREIMWLCFAPRVWYGRRVDVATGITRLLRLLQPWI